MTAKDIKNLSKRMYLIVNYQLNPIQAGIQAGHAALEYVAKYNNENTLDFIIDHKTWVVLNGGTTNNDGSGTLNQIVEKLKELDYPHATFQEPDLNMALTAVCLIVDERIWNRDLVPDFLEFELKLRRDSFNLLNMTKSVQDIYVDKYSKEVVELKKLLNDLPKF